MRALGNDVVDERHDHIETEQHEQSLTDEDGYRPKAGNEASHDKTVYIMEASR